MIILAFTGMPWSGKSEAVKIAQEKGFNVIRMGDFVWDEVKKRDLELNSENVGLIANEMRQTHGMNIWAIKTHEKIESLKNKEIVIVDGVRSISELNYFKSYFDDNFLLITINANNQIRHHRALTRRREDDSFDINIIKKRDEREKSWGITDLINKSDIIINNNNSIDSFMIKIDKLFKSTLKR